MNEHPGILAIDVGSSRVKLGWFPPGQPCGETPENPLPIAAPKLPEPISNFAVEHDSVLEGTALNSVRQWLEDTFTMPPSICLASVRPRVVESLQRLFGELGWQDTRQLTYQDLPLEIRVDEPARVGIDRLLNAVGVNLLRPEGSPAIVVDLGTAGTVDLVSAEGTFLGGAILPGISLSARALHSATASLPKLEVPTSHQPIAVVGKNTEAAITSGLYWGIVGALNGLIRRIAEQCDVTPQLYITGGGAGAVAPHLRVGDSPGRHLPHLVLSSIVATAEGIS